MSLRNSGSEKYAECVLSQRPLQRRGDAVDIRNLYLDWPPWAGQTCAKRSPSSGTRVGNSVVNKSIADNS